MEHSEEGISASLKGGSGNVTKQAQAACLAPELDFRLLFESIPGLYLVLTPEFRIAAASDAYLRATLTTRQQIMALEIFEAFPDNPNDPTATGVRNLRASLERVVQAKCPDTMAVQKYDIRRPDSQGGGFEERFWSPVNSPVLNDQGEVIYIIHRVEDVTEFIRLKQARMEDDKNTEALRIRAQQMEAEVYQRAQELSEANRQLQTANTELARLYGQISLLLTQAQVELQRSGAGHEPVETRTDGPQEMLARLGDLIAGHKRLEAELRQSQKMEAIGQLAGGIAHDFNNVLGIILGYCQLLAAQAGDDHLMHAKLDEIRNAAERAADLTRQLLVFSRRQVLEPKVISLASTVEEMQRMLLPLLGANVQVVTRAEENIGHVKLDPSQAQQLILNLALNARDAMPDGGKLTVELRNVDIGERLALQEGLAPGPHVMLSVADEGTGMSPEVKDRIFEPFFTTKEVGKGTGMGLATVYGIVKQGGGAISVSSEPGMGSEFRIFLPAVDERPASRVTDGRQRPAGGHETILIVEDNAPMQRLVNEVLRSAGYNTLVAGDGDEALEICNGFTGDIDLLLTDFMLPKMSGRVVAERVTALRPRVKTIFMSGYTGDSLAGNGGCPEADFLQKPFTPRTLCSRVRASLDSSRQRSKILVVDDEPAARELMTAMLELHGFNVVTAANGREARNTADQQSFDLVITDLGMPEEDGIEMIRGLRRNHPNLRVIAVSGAFGSDILYSAKLLGADATLMKPFTTSQLVDCIEALPKRQA